MPGTKISKLFSTVLFIALFFPIALAAQNTDQTSSNSDKPNLFLDCGYCYQSYLKENVTFVNYVRDKEDAQIHLLITRAQTGSGGTEFTLSFYGQDMYDGMDDEITFSSPDTDTDQETRAALANYIKIGLIPYLSQTPLINNIGISYDGTEQESTDNGRDKWNYWIFNIGGDASVSGEEQQSSLELRGEISADRITENLKIELEADGNFERETFQLNNEDTTFTSNRESFEALVVKSISPHWSVGASSRISSSTFRNIKFQAGASPAIEYNIFPYREYNVHEFSFLYQISPTYYQYRDTTIFNKTEEFLVEQSLEIDYNVTKTWGSINASLEGSNFMHDFSKNRVDFRGRLNFRVFRGLSLNVFGNYSLINDQIALPGEGVTDEEALLRLRDRATGYEYRIGFGLNYTFGSIFNNIVNPRF